MNPLDKIQPMLEAAPFRPSDLINPKWLIENLGPIGVLAIMFAETGLLVGFFFPGDSLLFLAGVAASPVADEIVGARMPLPLLLIGAPICAIVGAQLGHFLGARYGAKMFDRPNSKLFKREYVDKAEYYFDKFGPAKAVVLARFIPIVRTFLNPVAGVLGMSARKFLLWNIVGAVLWTDGVLLIGWGLAEQITKAVPGGNIDKYILPVTALIVIISAMPIFIEVFRSWRARRQIRRDAAVAADNAVAGTVPADTVILEERATHVGAPGNHHR